MAGEVRGYCLALFRPADDGGRRWREVHRAVVALTGEADIDVPSHFVLEVEDGSVGRFKFLLTDAADADRSARHRTPLAEVGFSLADLLSTGDPEVTLQTHAPSIRGCDVGFAAPPLATYPRLNLSLMGMHCPDGHWHGFRDALPDAAVARLLRDDAAHRAGLGQQEAERWGRLTVAWMVEHQRLRFIDDERRRRDEAARQEAEDCRRRDEEQWEGTAAWAARRQRQVSARGSVLPPPTKEALAAVAEMTLAYSSSSSSASGKSRGSFAPLAVEQHSCFIYDDHLYVFGGTHEDSEENELYAMHLPAGPPAAPRWQRLETLRQIPLGRHGHTTTVVGHEAVLIGGVGLGGCRPTVPITSAESPSLARRGCSRSRSASPATLLDRSPSDGQRDRGPHSRSPTRHRCANTDHELADLTQPSVEVSLNSEVLQYVISNRNVTPIVLPHAPDAQPPFLSGFVPDVYGLDLPTRQWRLLGAPEPVHLWRHSAVPYRREVMVFGGVGLDLRPCNVLRAFHCDAFQWRTISCTGNVPDARHGHAAARYHAEMVLFGGHTQQGYASDTYVLDIETSTWHELLCTGQRPAGRAGHSAAVHGDCLLVCGGRVSDRHAGRDVYCLNLRTQVWQEVTVRNVDRSWRPLHSHIACAGGQKGTGYLVVFGGRAVPHRRRVEDRRSRSRPLWQRAAEGLTGPPPPPAPKPKGKVRAGAPVGEVTNACFVLKFGADPPPQVPTAEPSAEGEISKDALTPRTQQFVDRLFSYHKAYTERQQERVRASCPRPGKQLSAAQAEESAKRLCDGGVKRRREVLGELQKKYEVHEEALAWRTGLQIPKLAAKVDSLLEWEQEVIARFKECKEQQLEQNDLQPLVQRLYEVQTKKKKEAVERAQEKFPSAGALTREQVRAHAALMKATQEAAAKLNRRLRRVTATPLAALAAPLRPTAASPPRARPPAPPRPRSAARRGRRRASSQPRPAATTAAAGGGGPASPPARQASELSLEVSTASGRGMSEMSGVSLWAAASFREAGTQPSPTPAYGELTPLDPLTTAANSPWRSAATASDMLSSHPPTAEPSGDHAPVPVPSPTKIEPPVLGPPHFTADQPPADSAIPVIAVEPQTPEAAAPRRPLPAPRQASDAAVAAPPPVVLPTAEDVPPTFCESGASTHAEPPPPPPPGQTGGDPPGTVGAAALHLDLRGVSQADLTTSAPTTAPAEDDEDFDSSSSVDSDDSTSDSDTESTDSD